MSGTVPVIDIAPFLDGSDKPAVARSVAEACERIGFLIVSGHGLDAGTVERAFERSRAFFDLPRAEKDRWHPTGRSRQRGFHGFATRGLAYTLGEDAPPDLRETYFLGPVNDHRAHFAHLPDAANAYAPNLYPDAPKGAAEALVAIYRAYERLSADLMRIFAVALDQPEDYFAGWIARHFSILSSHHYPALREQPRPGQLRTGAHTDFGALTILAMTDADGGLEVRMPDGAWQPVRPPLGTLVVNLGDMMARWTNGRWTSTLHRVANPRDLNSARSRRQTIGYFMHPDYDAPIRAIPSCVPSGEEPKFPTISAGEHIAMKIARSHDGAAVAAKPD
ncbi:MAG: isopenicillin N synthase family oxygenase [Alphaproteobacteria bacterium]|nr:isopenicillin N synthase family oxygenase [Alphaproteobacteria bacterium]